jgi:hypothetical protein
MAEYSVQTSQYSWTQVTLSFLDGSYYYVRGVEGFLTWRRDDTAKAIIAKGTQRVSLLTFLE